MFVLLIFSLHGVYNVLILFMGSGSNLKLDKDTTFKLNDILKEIAQIETDRLIFIDETGANLDLTPAYGRSPIGQRTRKMGNRRMSRACETHHKPA
jgi:hypothetical protein